VFCRRPWTSSPVNSGDSGDSAQDARFGHASPRACGDSYATGGGKRLYAIVKAVQASGRRCLSGVPDFSGIVVAATKSLQDSWSATLAGGRRVSNRVPHSEESRLPRQPGDRKGGLKPRDSEGDGRPVGRSQPLFYQSFRSFFGFVWRGDPATARVWRGSRPCLGGGSLS